MREQHFEYDKKLNIDFYEGIPQCKIYECNECDQIFKRKSDLGRHVANVHEGKSFDCGHCGMKYARKDNLHRHVKTKHVDPSKD